jgi:TRAP-type C4-dicarboxylate transport system substrate-binding protein
MPTERYDAMSKGVFNAAIAEWEGEFAWNLNELTHYSTECGLYVMAFAHIMNLDTWNSLPPDLQELFVGENAETLFTLLGYNFDKDDLAFREQLDAQYKADGYEGVYVLPDAERAKWVDAIMPVREQWVQEASAVVGEAKARAILADALAFAKQYGGYPDEACPECAGILHDWGAPGY